MFQNENQLIYYHSLLIFIDDKNDI